MGGGGWKNKTPSGEGVLVFAVSHDGGHCRFFRPLQASTPGLRRAQTLAAAQLGDTVAAFFIGLTAWCTNLLRSWGAGPALCILLGLPAVVSLAEVVRCLCCDG